MKIYNISIIGTDLKTIIAYEQNAINKGEYILNSDGIVTLADKDYTLIDAIEEKIKKIVYSSDILITPNYIIDKHTQYIMYNLVDGNDHINKEDIYLLVYTDSNYMELHLSYDSMLKVLSKNHSVNDYEIAYPKANKFMNNADDKLKAIIDKLNDDEWGTLRDRFADFYVSVENSVKM